MTNLTMQHNTQTSTHSTQHLNLNRRLLEKVEAEQKCCKTIKSQI